MAQVQIVSEGPNYRHHIRSGVHEVIADEPALAPAIVLDRITEPGHNPL